MTHLWHEWRPATRRPVAIDRDVRATMRDGIELVADVYRPDDEGTYPVLLYRTPYDKSARYETTAGPEVAQAGYIVVMQDVRGMFDSGGDFSFEMNLEGMAAERCDGYDSVEWAARLPGSDGRVGLWGISFPTSIHWQAVAAQPPSLVGMISSGTPPDLRMQQFGVFGLHWLSWFVGLAAGRLGRPSDADWALVDKEELAWQHFLPLEDLAPPRFGHMRAEYLNLLRNIHRDLLEWEQRVQPFVKVPVLTLNGFWDMGGVTIDQHLGVLRHCTDRELLAKHRLVVGPWGHVMDEDIAGTGALSNPRASSTFARETVRWYDWLLKGLPTGYEDGETTKVFLSGEEDWRVLPSYPPAAAEPLSWYLTSGGNANTAAGDGRLVPVAPQQAGSDRYSYDPRDPLPGGGNSDPPVDLRFRDSREDLLVYVSDPLDEDVVVCGNVDAQIWVTSSAPETDFAVSLLEVRSDGVAYPVAFGLCRTRFLDGYGQVHRLEPEVPVRLDVWMRHAGVRLKAGSRLRLDVGSAEWPEFHRNHNTGNPYWSDTELITAEQAVLHGGERTSHVSLPVLRAEAQA